MDPMTWVYIALLVISIFVASKAAKRNNAQPSSLKDFNVPTAQDGRPVSMCFGDVWIDDQNFIDYGNLRTEPIKASGGK
jgi:hypothetical protein